MGKRGEVLPIEHGSDYANAQRCHRQRTQAGHVGMCGECRPVHAAYHRERRQACGAARAKQRSYNLARTRAWARLQQRYPEEFAGLMDQELRRVARQAEEAA